MPCDLAAILTWRIVARSMEGAMFARLILIAAAAIALPGCTQTETRSDPEPEPRPNSQLTHGNVQMNLEAGKTSQTEVLEKFGSPNITSIDSSGNEVWTYQRQATVEQSSSARNYWTVVLFGGSTRTSGLEQTQRTATLMIKFDSNKVVSDFRSRTSEF
jgi:outer membrane protein assembly factor BamE (lipoprotein component of BamABCDE complex)